MKKHRISKRIFAMLLVICMVFTMLPTNMKADDYVKGDRGDEGLGTGITSLNENDTISWPIKIYDYYNDGMLFEYASWTGDGKDFTLRDEIGRFVHMPDMTTNYYSDFTTEEINDSYIVKNHFASLGLGATQSIDNATTMKYYTFGSALGSKDVQLIDFQGLNEDGLLERWGATTDEEGKYNFTNACGYTFAINDVNGTIDGEDATIVNTEAAYNSCKPNHAVSVQLRPTGNPREYSVVKVVAIPGSASAAGITFEDGDIVMVVHSADSKPGQYANWMSKVAAVALKEGDIVTVASDDSAVVVESTSNGANTNDDLTVSKDNAQYAVLAYRATDLEEDGTLEAVLTDKYGTKYYGYWETVEATGTDTTSDWRYAVLDFRQFTKSSDSENEIFTVSGGDWETAVVNDIKSVGIRFIPDYQPLNDSTGDKVDYDSSYQFMISHFALFSTEAAAKAYGEKALVNNKHYIYNDIENNFPDMTTEYGSDFTTDEMANSEVVTSWFDKWYIATEAGWNNDIYYSQYEYTSDTATDTNGDSYQVGSKYYKFHTFSGGGTELIDFSATGNVPEGTLTYGTLVYRLEGLNGGTGNITPFIRGTAGQTFYESIPTYDTGWWTITFPINYSGDISSAGILFSPTTEGTDYDFIVSHFALFETDTEAYAYAQKALKYHANYDKVKAYYNPIYSNYQYGLLEGVEAQSSSTNKLTDRIGYNPSNSDTGYFGEDGQIYYLTTSKTDYEMDNIKFDGYQLLGTITNGTLTAGLLEGKLDETTGKPVYRDEVITYLAELLAATLVIPSYKDGKFNYDCVRGEASVAYGDKTDDAGNIIEEIDLATAIRRRVHIDLDAGDYDPIIGNITDTNANKDQLIGSWQTCKSNINSCYDAAYYLLNNIFIANSYNQYKTTYSSLVLNEVEGQDGHYIFDAGYSNKQSGEDGNEYDKSALVYNEENGTIKTIGATNKATYYIDDNGTYTTLFPFLPIRDAEGNQEQTMSPYFHDQGVGYDAPYGETYYGRNYNYVMESNAKFVYNPDDDLYFEFEGDDDVYLFINGQLVLDIGGAHGITKQRIDIDEYVKAAKINCDKAISEGRTPDLRDQKLNLQKDQVCDFDFFYMERHGYGANCRISTNMIITDPSIDVDKTAYQDGNEIIYGGVVNSNDPIEYQFKLENKGNTKLYNLSFIDENIGVKIDSKDGLTITNPESNGVTVMDRTGDKLDIGDLTFILTGFTELKEGETTDKTRYDRNEDGEMKEAPEGKYVETPPLVYTFDTKKQVIDFMSIIKADDTGQGTVDTNVTTEGSGLWINGAVTVKGIYYKMTYEQKEAGMFNNKLDGYATVYSDPNSEEKHSSDKHKVVLPGRPYYYQWATKDIIITKEQLVGDMSSDKRYEDLFDEKNGVVLSAENIDSIIEVDKLGLTTNIPEVLINDSNQSIKVNYSKPDTYTFYVKITYSNEEKTKTQETMVPIIINTTQVQDSYMVLDYGLKVDLTGEKGIFEKDSLHTSNNTEAEIMGITATKTAEGEDYTPTYTANEDGNHLVTFSNPTKVIADDKTKNENNYNGAFTLSDNELIYKPDELMEKMDSIWVAVHVHEEETYDKDEKPDGFKAAELNEEIDISKEVQMFKKVSVLPANVVYYEDDFPAIVYNIEGEGIDLEKNPNNVFKQLDGKTDEAENDIHEGSSSLTQSADQDQEYGQDKEYQNNSDKSGKSITQITVNTAGVVASFDFKGTGFELICRTKAELSATILVTVTNGEGEVEKNIPVITEFDHGDNGGEEIIYQVPVIRVEGLNYEPHTVTISAVPSRVNGQRVAATLYIDGFRIYNPYGDIIIEDENADDQQVDIDFTPGASKYYTDSENGALFSEIRDLIMNAKAVVARYNDELTQISYGEVTWTENHTGKDYNGEPWESKKANSINDYLMFGPNNEVYMDGSYTDGNNAKEALVFYVDEIGEEKGSLQIAVREINKGLFENGTLDTAQKTAISYGIEEKQGDTVSYKWQKVTSVSSATEQYYTIDYTKCPYKDGKGYQVVIKVDSGMVSYSSIKSTGLTFTQMTDGEAEETTLRFENGVLVDSTTGKTLKGIPELLSIRKMLASDEFYKEEINVDEKICYQVRNDSDVRLIGYVDDLTKYSSVSFTLTFNGKTSKPLVCTTAYSGLYANGELKTTEDIYGTEGHFVTFVINDYLKAARGQKVFITITYTNLNGEEHTEGREITIY